ncbi:MAG: glycosyltransferase family 4 protein [Chloroflexi bacterium]|nr:glycosyltransferase family 4 protein [Chloroflexota bacterium]
MKDFWRVMSRIRVLEIGKSTAGIGTYLRWLAAGLDLERFQLTFACLSERGMELAYELGSIKDIRAISWPMNRFKVDPFSDLLLTLRIARLIRSEKFDLVHAHGSKAGFLARLAAIGSGVPVAYSPHCFSFHAGVSPLTANFFAALERFAARFLTARIITVANGEQILATRFRVGSPKLFVTVHSGIDPDLSDKSVDKTALKASLNLDKNAKLVGAVGRLGNQKAPLDFVRMSAFIHARMPQIQFVWAGSGPLDDSARKLSKELGVAKVCHFIGEYKDIPSLLSLMDCFVLPSLWEGFPIVLLEAMAAGVPIVATDIPGNDEVISSGGNGWLVPPGDSSALAEKVLALLNNHDQASMFVAAGRDKIQKEFTRAKMLTTIQNVYQDVVDEKGCK